MKSSKVIAIMLSSMLVLGLTGCSNPLDLLKKDKGEDTVVDVPVEGEEIPSTEVDEDFSQDTDISLNIPEGTEPVEEEQTVEEETKEKSDKKKTFKEQHPYLFAFRFDGTTAYVDEASYTAPEQSGDSAGSVMQDTTDSYTEITMDVLPQTLRMVNELPGYNLTTARNNGFAMYESSDGKKIKVEPLSASEYEKRKETLQSTSDFSEYKFTTEEFVYSKDKFTKAVVTKIKYTLRDGSEGEMPWSLSCYLANDSVLFITNFSMSKDQNESSLTTIYKNCINWVEE